MDIIKKLKANPLISMVLAIAFLGGTVTGGVSGITAMDSLIMTQQEHTLDMVRHENSQHPATASAIKDLKQWNRCDRLERRENELSQRLWQLNQSSTTTAITTRNAETDLADIMRQFNDLNCGVVLATG